MKFINTLKFIFGDATRTNVCQYQFIHFLSLLCSLFRFIREIMHRSIDKVQQENIIIFSYKIGELSCAWLTLLPLSGYDIYLCILLNNIERLWWCCLRHETDYMMHFLQYLLCTEWSPELLITDISARYNMFS